MFTVGKLYNLISSKLLGKVFLEAANYQIKKEVLKEGGRMATINLESRAALLAAKQGLAGAASRYLGVRSIMLAYLPKRGYYRHFDWYAPEPHFRHILDLFPGEAVNLSQLNLINLAGSESSKAETTGIRRKEGAYINKSLLTLGTVISKLSDGRAAHIPYRDSKLTRLLQSFLSGHGRRICTVTPSSSNSEEIHNTLKFAHHAKHIEIQAPQNKINDEKSLIKAYQNQIRSLKEELHQLEQEGEAKDALLSQIQSLTRLILVSTKSPHQTDPGSKYSFREEEVVGDQLPVLHRALVEKSAEVQRSEQVLVKNKETLNKLKEVNVEQERDVERVRQRDELYRH
ncbi:unnamed protein product [Lactuca virosa]|uniref:Kinesin-like protein n=1 Tax=Lactuca virosa TaxID=75947 RepID=A0AAU9NQ67_9ASTR|nr:unnamed protein product [Lactuca virosa]